MKPNGAGICFFFTIVSIFSQLLLPCSAEPVQYCRFGHRNGEVDFCMGVTMHHNFSADAYDLYLSLTVTRSSPFGWTAIGTGPTMAGSLMFIVYGDPSSSSSSGQGGPILSIRTADGHHHPTLVEPERMGGADLRVLQANWMSTEGDPSSPTRKAKFAVVCYACSRFPGSAISATTSSQPWIWAWNADQHMDVFTFDTALNMHAHHAGNGGWGVFFLDMARSASEQPRLPSLPPLRPGVARLGASDDPIGASGLVASLKARPLVGAHGFAMGTAFLFLSPLGVAALRSNAKGAFRLHWVMQVLSAGFVVAGAVFGLVMSRGSRVFATTHQWVGLAIVAAIAVQALLGWRHHVAFLRVRRRTWMSHTHIWLGRLVVMGGWFNMLGGIFLAGHGRAGVAAVSGLIAFEALGVVVWVCAAKFRLRRKRQAEVKEGEREEGGRTAFLRDGVERYFALGEESGDEDEEGEYGNKKDEEVVEKPRKSMAVEKRERAELGTDLSA